MTVSPDTSLGAAVCRICHSGEQSIPYLGSSGGEPLISPCHCKGTMGLYHRSCLEHWLTLSATACCEICNFRFELEKKYRSFLEFIRGRGCVMDEGRGTATDLVCFFILTPFALGSSFICFRAGIYATDSNGKWDMPEGIAMLSMSLFLIFIYSMWLSVTGIYYRAEYRSWRTKNELIRVRDQLSADESLLFNGSRSESRFIILKNVFTTSFMRLRGRDGRSEPMIGQISRVELAVSPVHSFYSRPDDVQYPDSVYIPPREPISTLPPVRFDVPPSPRSFLGSPGNAHGRTPGSDMAPLSSFGDVLPRTSTPRTATTQSESPVVPSTKSII